MCFGSSWYYNTSMAEKHTHFPPSWLSYTVFVIGILALLGALFLSINTTQTIRRNFRGLTTETNVNLVESWMTLSYVSHAYHIPENVVREKLHLAPNQTLRISIKKLAENTHISPDVFLKNVREMISTFQKTEGTPPTPSV